MQHHDGKYAHRAAKNGADEPVVQKSLKPVAAEDVIDLGDEDFGLPGLGEDELEDFMLSLLSNGDKKLIEYTRAIRRGDRDEALRLLAEHEAEHPEDQPPSEFAGETSEQTVDRLIAEAKE